MLALWLLVPLGCQKEIKNQYYIFISDTPEIAQPDVYRNGDKIGQIASREFGPDGATRLTIEIDKEFLGSMTDNVVFFVSKGQLNYETIEPAGQPLQPGASFLGFKSKTGLFWFKVRTVLNRRSVAAAMEAEKILKKHSWQ